MKLNIFSKAGSFARPVFVLKCLMARGIYQMYVRMSPLRSLISGLDGEVVYKVLMEESLLSPQGLLSPKWISKSINEIIESVEESNKAGNYGFTSSDAYGEITNFFNNAGYLNEKGIELYQELKGYSPNDHESSGLQNELKKATQRNYFYL